MLKSLLCKLRGGHFSNPPIIEVLETRSGIQKSVYLCRRCFCNLGEKPYA